MKRGLYSALAQFSMFTAGISSMSNASVEKHNPYYANSKADRLIQESKQIKGISAKEMGTSGKKKLPKSKRRNINNKNKRKK